MVIADSSDEIHVIRFKDEKIQRGSRIYMNGVPFMIVGTRLMECHQGPSHYKSVAERVCSCIVYGFYLSSALTFKLKILSDMNYFRNSVLHVNLNKSTSICVISFVWITQLNVVVVSGCI